MSLCDNPNHLRVVGEACAGFAREHLCAFADPEKVLGHDVLTREQKIRVLKLVGDAGIMHTDPSKQHSLI